MSDHTLRRFAAINPGRINGFGKNRIRPQKSIGPIFCLASELPQA